MSMSVDQTRHDRFAAKIESLRASRNGHVRADRRDAAVPHDDGPALNRVPARSIDDAGPDESLDARRCQGLARCRRKQDKN